MSKKSEIDQVGIDEKLQDEQLNPGQSGAFNSIEDGLENPKSHESGESREKKLVPRLLNITSSPGEQDISEQDLSKVQSISPGSDAHGGQFEDLDVDSTLEKNLSRVQSNLSLNQPIDISEKKTHRVESNHDLPSKTMEVHSIATVNSQIHSENQTGPIEIELKELLKEKAKQKTSEYGQTLLSICENMSCSRRFWCGISCVKEKELFMRYLEDMKTIDDYIDEKINTLSSAKSFTQDEKDHLNQKIDREIEQKSIKHQRIIAALDQDFQKIKKELLEKLKEIQNGMEQKILKYQSDTEEFLQKLKTKVNNSSSRNLYSDLEKIKAEIDANQIDVLNVISDLGVMVEDEIPEIDRSNREFEKVKQFMYLIEEDSEMIDEVAVPEYRGINESQIEDIVRKSEGIITPFVKSNIKNPGQQLEKVYHFYESIAANEGIKESKFKLQSYILNCLNEERENVRGSTTSSVYNDNLLSTKLHAGSQYLQKSNLRDSQKRRDHPSENEQTELQYLPERERQSFKQSNYIQKLDMSPVSPDQEYQITKMMNSVDAEGAVIHVQTNTTTNDIDKRGLLPITEKKLENFCPIIDIARSTYLFTTFAKNCPENGFIYGIKVYQLPNEKNQSHSLVYSSEKDFMLNKKITNLCFFTRESDGKEILALSSKEGTIFLMEVKHIRANKKTKLSIDLTRKIWPTSSETGITSIRNYENTDYLLCTNIFGDILIYDTTNGQLMSSDRFVDGAISSSAFLNNSTFLAIGSGSDQLSHDNSITFIAINPKTGKKTGQPPVLRNKFRIKNAHGDDFGVFSLVADNVAENSLVFSAGSSDNPTIKVWNFESRELVYFLETKDSFCQFYMNLIVLPISSKDGGLAQAKGAWKKKIDEISSYRKMRDEKKRKKNNDDTTLVSTSNVFGYIILVATDSCIRTIRLFLQDGIAVEFKEIQVDFKTNCDPGSCILQTLKKNDSEIQVYAGNSIGNVEIFDIKLS